VSVRIGVIGDDKPMPAKLSLPAGAPPRLIQGRTNVVLGNYEGKADVKDTVTLDFVWDKSTNKIVGSVTVTDGKTEVANLKSDGIVRPPRSMASTSTSNT